MESWFVDPPRETWIGLKSDSESQTMHWQTETYKEKTIDKSDELIKIYNFETLPVWECQVLLIDRWHWQLS